VQVVSAIRTDKFQRRRRDEKDMLAIDGSECAKKAVAYVGEQFSNMKDLKITLLHVLPISPRHSGTTGIYSVKKKETREEGRGQMDEKPAVETRTHVHECCRDIDQGGIKPEQIETKAITDSMDVADSILEEIGMADTRHW